MYLYKFNGHFRGIGQDEYLSQGKYNYANNIDMNLQNIYFKLGKLPVIHGKVPYPETISKIVTLGSSQYALGTSESKVWYVGSSDTPTTGYDPITDASVLDFVFHDDQVIDIIPMMKSGNVVYYLFQYNKILEMLKSAVSGSTPWTPTTTYSGLTFVQRVFANYLDSRLYFAQWDGGNQFKLSKLDEFGIKTDNVLGGRYFSSKIVGLTITGTVLNIYLENGHKSLMDLSTETIIETVNFNKSIRSVVGYGNRDYVLCDSENNLGISVSAGYEIQDILKNSLCDTLGLYDELERGTQSSYKNNPVNDIGLFKIYRGSVYFCDDRDGSGKAINRMKSDYSIHSICSTDIVGDVMNDIKAIEVYNNRVYIAYKKSGSSDTFIASIPLFQSLYYQKNGYLVENVFTGGDITRKKEMVEIRLRANIPTGTRVKIKALCDGVLSDEVVEITGNTKKTHIHPFKASGYEIMFIYEVYNDIDYALGQTTPQIYEMEIGYNFIEN